jgi:hypothetical protein
MRYVATKLEMAVANNDSELATPDKDTRCVCRRKDGGEPSQANG